MKITLWLKTLCGPTKLEINDQLALFFIEAPNAQFAIEVLHQSTITLAKHQFLALKTFEQQEVCALYFSSLRHFYLARDLLKKHNIKCYEDDIRPDERYLMERFITAHIDFTGLQQETAKLSEQAKNGYQHFTQVKCKASSDIADINLSLLSIDIECSIAGELYSIGLYANNKFSAEFKRILMIGESQKSTEDIDNNIVWLKNEQELLLQFIEEIAHFDPDIIIGWNVINFDFRLLQQRFDKFSIQFRLGRDNSLARWRQNTNHNEQYFIDIAGRVILDGIDLLKTATYNFSSFSLDNVAKTLLGLSKKVSDVENRVQEITHNFHHNKHILAAYNLEDCRLVSLIFAKTSLLEFAMLRAQLTGLSLDRVGGSVSAFTNLYLPKLHRNGYIAPNMGDGKSGLISPGGYVMNSVPGLYDNVLVLDFKSLYPSIIRTFKIDPMGLIEGLLESEQDKHTDLPEVRQKRPIPAFDGAYFSRDKHFLPDIITSLWLERDKAKEHGNTALSQAIKIIMNSFYGVLGSTGCRFFDPRLSGAITKRGHEILKNTKVWIEEQGYQVIYGDTDSIFVHIGKSYNNRESSQLGSKLQNIINRAWQQKLASKFKLDCHLEIEFETHFSKFLMPTIRGLDPISTKQAKTVIGSKKRYVGLADNKLVFKGMETVRSDWTKASKIFQQELYSRIFKNEPVDDYIVEIVNDIRSGLFDDKLIYTKKIRRNITDYVNNPPHIKAAKAVNNQCIERGEKTKYKRGSKIDYVVTLDGIQALEMCNSTLDYDFYIEKQIRPVADDILPFIGSNFTKITSKQLGLF